MISGGKFGIDLWLLTNFKPGFSFTKAVFLKFRKIHRKTPVHQSSSLQRYKKDSVTGVFLLTLRIFFLKNTKLLEHLQTVATKHVKL